MATLSAVLHAPEPADPAASPGVEMGTRGNVMTSSVTASEKSGFSKRTTPINPEPEPDPNATADGRTRRRLNSYERAVDALLDLIQAGNDAPTAQQIADRSGISVRTVFRLTEDIESLHAAAVMRQIERTAHLYVTLPSTGTFETRLRTLVKNRVTVFETIAPIRRVGDRLAATSTRIAEGLALHHLMLRAQVAEVFERELKAMPRHKRATALDAADVAAGWEMWDQLRRGKGLSVTLSARVIEVLVGGALRG